MKKNSGKALVVTILIIFLVVAICFAVYFALKLDNKEKEIKTMQNDLNQIKEELNQKENEEKQKDSNSKENEVSINVDDLNEKYSKKILKIMGAGSCNGIYCAIMDIGDNYSEFNNLKRISQGGFDYRITNTNYTDYETKYLECMTKSVLDSILSRNKFIGNKAIINIDGKTAVGEATWSGTELIFESQKLMSKDDNMYVYEIKYKRPISMGSTEYTELSAIVTGKVSDGKYVIEKFEEK